MQLSPLAMRNVPSGPGASQNKVSITTLERQVRETGQLQGGEGEGEGETSRDEGGTPRRSNTRVFHFTWTLIVHLCAHWREEGWDGEGGEDTATDVGSEEMRVQKRKRERKGHAGEAIADVARQGEKESKEEN
ncbi:hypothetical protein G5I_14287 [Acromyrmex echinatior]|uniref:Uncharacterized protein n=1 Tax=Acromyrmex echinatior TaxID=103372 RepID=F4X6Z7_ACREC|nr:hypothetical protein G5I_14287 [Acromyrmex echinatior]